MALNLKDVATHDLARRVAAATGESLTTAVRIALEERLARVEQATSRSSEELAARLDSIAIHCGGLPVRRQRSEDEILGYDQRGMPGSW